MFCCNISSDVLKQTNVCFDSLLYKFTQLCFPSWTDGFPNISSCNLDGEDELEINSPEELEFSFFQEDLVAEQLTYMDAVCRAYIFLDMPEKIVLGF